MVMRFKDREDAGEKLAEELETLNLRPDTVLAIPRGGLPLGRKVADTFNADLDVVVARKIGAPGNPELAIGAVASDGTRWLNHDMIERLGISREYVEEETGKEAENAREKLEFMRRETPPAKLEGKTVAVVDDGIATGATAIACLRQVKNQGAEKVILAVPVGPRETAEKLGEEADEIVVVETPARFGSVGVFYKNFDQITDEKAREYLER